MVRCYEFPMIEWVLERRGFDGQMHGRGEIHIYNGLLKVTDFLCGLHMTSFVDYTYRLDFLCGLHMTDFLLDYDFRFRINRLDFLCGLHMTDFLLDYDFRFRTNRLHFLFGLQFRIGI